MSTGLPTAGRRRQKRAQLGACGLAQRRKLQPVGFARIGGQNPRTTGVGENRDPGTPRHWLMRQQRRDVEQLLEPLGADDAGLTEQRIDDGVAGGQRAGMRGGRARSGGRASRLHRDDRLASRHPPRDLAELLRIPEALEIEQNHRRPGVVGPGTESGRCPTHPPCCRPTRNWRCRYPGVVRSPGSPVPGRRSAWTSRHCRRGDTPGRTSRSIERPDRC